mmetsp:Transcript_24515/g.56012  ORF Transcript_24515/g.56012 Transcript_24515/m.56012 type:complete len:299 (+) Transcript_24515:549-1445(+)
MVHLYLLVELQPLPMSAVQPVEYTFDALDPLLVQIQAFQLGASLVLDLHLLRHPHHHPAFCARHPQDLAGDDVRDVPSVPGHAGHVHQRHGISVASEGHGHSERIGLGRQQLRQPGHPFGLAADPVFKTGVFELGVFGPGDVVHLLFPDGNQVVHAGMPIHQDHPDAVPGDPAPADAAEEAGQVSHDEAVSALLADLVEELGAHDHAVAVAQGPLHLRAEPAAVLLPLHDLVVLFEEGGLLDPARAAEGQVAGPVPGAEGGGDQVGPARLAVPLTRLLGQVVGEKTLRRGRGGLVRTG